ncbi:MULTISPECIES: hypothetical protein [Microbacterium]|uniref:hypothetical protein n=1 Tax=Microbacterium TaxID=33882 RepID=UPI00277D50DC|nr:MULTISPECIES: hypothetical protein [Microbacterium]MDQ1085341.1 hypothetical protein [Microbacterium sp. SORGH_AS_0344]MDQ1169353.1 hypothetical protein [Microbacterium proteolyticum]
MGLSFGLLGVCVAVAAAVLFVAVPRIGTPGPLTLFLRFAAASGVAAVGSSAMYFIHGAGGGILTLAFGDVSMVSAPALMVVAVCVLAGRGVRRAAVGALSLAIIVGAVALTVPLPGSLAVKALCLTFACGACLCVVARLRPQPSGPLWFIATVNGVYAVFSLTRVVVLAVAGWDSPLYAAAFSFGPTTVLGALAVLLIGAAVVRVRFGPRVAAPPAARAGGTVVVVGDWDLASAAFGSDRMRELVRELRAAARDLDETAVDVPRGVDVVVPDALSALDARLRAGYGWTSGDTILLVDDGSQSAPPRVGRFRRGARASED